MLDREGFAGVSAMLQVIYRGGERLVATKQGLDVGNLVVEGRGELEEKQKRVKNVKNRHEDIMLHVVVV